MPDPKEYEFCPALRAFAPREKAASFILLNLVVHREEMIEWLSKKEDEDVRFDIRVTDASRSFPWPVWGAATPFATVNAWKPKPRGDYDASGSTPRDDDDAF